MKVFDLCNIAKVVKIGFDDLADMRLEGEGGIKDHWYSCEEGEISVLSLLSLRGFGGIWC